MEGISYSIFMPSWHKVALIIYGLMLVFLLSVTELIQMGSAKEVEKSVVSNESIGLARKLVLSPGSDRVKRIGRMTCSRDDVSIFQGTAGSLPNGIPAFTVQILNACVSGCRIGGIHVSCGWFSSVRLVNPRVFRRVDYDDCLVNDGEPLGPGETLSFQYANTFSYPLSVSSVAC